MRLYSLLLSCLALFFLSCSKPLPASGEVKVDSTASETKPTGPTQIAIFAGGCFWCTEASFEQLRGVVDVTSGYAGDSKETADYRTVSSGDTKHAEAVKVTYDPSKISYNDLLHAFFVMHDPTTKDQQGNDIGPQYRSAIFYLNDEQKKAAETYIQTLTNDKAFSSPIVTTFEPLTPEDFYPAEDYHQDYVVKNPSHPYVQAIALSKVKKVREKCADLLR